MSSIQSSPDVVIPPGSTIGILGSGQLGRMMAIAAKQMGYYVHVLSPSQDSPAGQVSDLEVTAGYDDLKSIESFARQVDVVTLEFENIPAAGLKVAAAHAPVHPGIKSLWTTQNRGREKQFLRDLEIPTCDFRVVHNLYELKAACIDVFPAVLKTTENGYDGKGQAFIRTQSDIEPAWQKLNCDEAIVEKLIDFEYEFSVVAARSSTGEVAVFPAIRNEHHNHILDVSVSPSGLTGNLEARAREIADQILGGLGSIGVSCVEFFYADGEVLVNEIAPRPHNSGHLTIEGHHTSQFEQHIRAVCGLPLGSTRQTQPIALANVMGEAWDQGTPPWHLALTNSDVKLHLYGKSTPEVGRKMGHMTAVADSATAAREAVIAARAALAKNQDA